MASFQGALAMAMPQVPAQAQALTLPKADLNSEKGLVIEGPQGKLEKTPDTAELLNAKEMAAGRTTMSLVPAVAKQYAKASAAEASGPDPQKDSLMAGPKTVGTLTGLKSTRFPTSRVDRDWVLEGVNPANARPLFGGSQDEAPEAEAARMLAAVNALHELGAERGLFPSTQANPQLVQTMSEMADGHGALPATSNPSKMTRGQMPLRSGQLESEPAIKNDLAAPMLVGSDFVDTLAGIQNRPAENQSIHAKAIKPDQSQGVMTASSLKENSLFNLNPVKGRDKALTAKSESLVAPHALQHDGAAKFAALTMPEVSAEVTKGAGARDRLTSDALTNVSTQIRNITPNGGGEMRIRLKPDSLGEVHVRVVSDGKDVGLQIHASSEQARQVIQDSMSHLKESLAGHRLNLSSFDVSVTTPGLSGPGSPAISDSQANGQFNYTDAQKQQAYLGQNGQGSESRGGRSNYQSDDTENGVRGVGMQIGPSSLSGSLQGSRGGLGRIDVRA